MCALYALPHSLLFWLLFNTFLVDDDARCGGRLSLWSSPDREAPDKFLFTRSSISPILIIVSMLAVESRRSRWSSQFLVKHLIGVFHHEELNTGRSMTQINKWLSHLSACVKIPKYRSPRVHLSLVHGGICSKVQSIWWIMDQLAGWVLDAHILRTHVMRRLRWWYITAAQHSLRHK